VVGTKDLKVRFFSLAVSLDESASLPGSSCDSLSARALPFFSFFRFCFSFFSSLWLVPSTAEADDLSRTCLALVSTIASLSLSSARSCRSIASLSGELSPLSPL
jgi:hypothetical protein